MLGANYLGSTYLGQGWSGVVSLPAISPVASWVYATPTTTLQSDEVTQFLTLHEMSVVAQGSPVVTVTGSLNTWQNLGAVDQPFVAPANVGWLRIPVSSTNLVPTTEPGWSNAAPITVQLCEDSGGVPGTVIAETIIPAEQIEAVQLATWPEPDDLLFGVPVVDTQASLPQLPGSGWAGITSLVAGAWAVLFATQNSNDTQMWLASFTGQDLGGWISGSTLPVSGVDQIVYAPNAQVFVLLSHGSLWTAAFSQTGTVGSWQSLPALAYLTNGIIGVVTYDGTDYLVAVQSNNATYYAMLSTSGGLGSWLVGAPFPVAFASGAGYQVNDDLVVVTHSGDVATIATLSTLGGSWMVTGTLAVTSTTVLGVIGTSLVTTNGTVIDVTSLTALGIAPWSLPVPLTAAGSSVSLFAFSTGTEYVLFWVPTTSGASGWRQPAYTPSWVSVPLSNSLTIGATYHLVLSATNDLTTGVAVPVVTPSSGSAGQIFNGATWEPLNGAVPFLAFYDANEGGMPVAFVASGKTTLMWFDTPSGALTTTVEIVDGTSISRLLTYSDGVLSEVA